MAELPRDIEADIEFLSEANGGRGRPCSAGYRGQFFYDGNDWDAVQEYIDVEEVAPGDRVKAFIAFLSPQKHDGKIYPLMPFLIREGNKTVGFGTVTKIIDLP